MLTKLSVQKPYTVIVAVALIIVLGVAALIGIKTDLLPDVDYPYAVVVTEYKDAAPSEVEATVTAPIEQALASVDHVKNVSSVSTAGKSIVEVQFDQNADMDSVVAEMREAFEPLGDDWGDNVGTPSIKKVNPDTMPVIVASVAVKDKDAAATSSFINDHLSKYFNGIDGIADVSSEGMVDQQIQITINKDKLAAVNKTIYDAIAGDYEKARAALAATDTQLDSATTQLSSDLLAKTAAIDTQVRSLNSQIAKAEATVADKEDEKDTLTGEISDLKDEKATLEAKPELTAEEEARLAAIETELTTANSDLSDVQKAVSDAKSKISDLESQISSLESQRSALTSQMNSSETEIAQSKASITKQLSDLDTAEESEKANADLESLITVDMVSSMLSAQNFSSSAGSLALGNKEYNVEVGDKITSVDELKQLVLFHFNVEGVDDVLLSAVADVELVDNSSNVYAKINGEDGVLFSFTKQSDVSTADAAKNVKAVFKTIEHKYSDVQITTLSDQSIYMDRVNRSITENLVIGGVLAVLILLVFLRDVRPTLVVGVSIPASLLFAVVMMYFTGVTINAFSLAGLALGVGMLVDNAIVVMENIYRCRYVGLSRKDAAIEGTRQVGGAIVASTLSTICVFVPVAFTNGLTRELFLDVGLTIAYALLASLFIAFTLIPALSAGLLKKVDRRRTSEKEVIKDRFELILRWVLGHRVFVLLFALLLLVFSVIFAASRGTSFIPKSDGTEMSITVSMQEETTTAALWKTTDDVVSLLRDMDDVKSVGAVADKGGTISLAGVSEGDATTVYVVLKDDKKHTCNEISKKILKETENLGCNLDISIGSYDLSSLYQDGIKVRIYGDDLDTLASLSKDMGDLLLSVDGITNVKDTMDTATPSLKVTVDKNKAMQYGLTVSEVYQFIANAISNSANATTLSGSGTDVIVIDSSSQNIGLADIQNLTMSVTDDAGNVSTVTIGSIAKITEEEGAPVIYRDNQQRYMTASAEIAGDANVGLVSKEVTELISGYDLPAGYSVVVEGENSAIRDALQDLLLVLGLSLLLMYLIMVAEFQSLLMPLIVMITVPLAFTGGFIALLISGKDISVVAIVGFLLLSGVIVNNGIVLVDYINRLKKSGKTLTDAIIEGSRTRLRPIVMTATATMLGVVTLAFGLGMGADLIQPMAIVVLGGMIYATFMTLFIVPALYDLLLRRREDDIAESGLEYYANDEDDGRAYLMEKRGRAKNGEEDEDDEDEDEEEEEEEKPRRRFGFLSRLKHDDDEEDDEEEEEDDEEEEQPRHRWFGFLRRRADEDEEDEEEEDDDKDDDGDEKPRRRWFGRRRDDDMGEDEDDNDDDEDDGDEEPKPKRGLFARWRRRFDDEEDEDEDDDAEDEDYYGLKQSPSGYLFSDDKKPEPSEMQEQTSPSGGFIMKKRSRRRD